LAIFPNQILKVIDDEELDDEKCQVGIRDLNQFQSWTHHLMIYCSLNILLLEENVFNRRI